MKRRRGNGDPDDDEGEIDSALSTRRDIIMHSVALAVLGPEALDTDGRTIVNSILGAYGLPKISVTKGFKSYDDFDEEYSFEYPISWVRRKNTLRGGVYIADFNTADKLSVETFPLGDTSTEFGTQDFVVAVVSRLLNPGKEVGGDSRIEIPRTTSIQWESRTAFDGASYIYIAFPSSTTTRSGYDIRRKNLAVAGVKRGVVYALGVSARSDQWNADKQELLQTIVDSFRVRSL